MELIWITSREFSEHLSWGRFVIKNSRVQVLSDTPEGFLQAVLDILCQRIVILDNFQHLKLIKICSFNKLWWRTFTFSSRMTFLILFCKLWSLFVQEFLYLDRGLLTSSSHTLSLHLRQAAQPLHLRLYRFVKNRPSCIWACSVSSCWRVTGQLKLNQIIDITQRVEIKVLDLSSFRLFKALLWSLCLRTLLPLRKFRWFLL